VGVAVTEEELAAMHQHPDAPDDANQPRLADVLAHNIRTLHRLHQTAVGTRRLQDRLADTITAVSGHMAFVYIHVVWFGAWIVVNTGRVGLRPFDPFPYGLLTMIVSLEAIFLATFVLISQNRMATLADRRADLDLQVSLLAEHEISRVISLVALIAERMGIEEARNPELAELERDVQPERVMEQIEAQERRTANDG
jgi:uncharacterized membrane protein